MPTRFYRVPCATLLALLMAPALAQDELASRAAIVPEPAPEGATVLRVGTGAGCTHSTIQAAINAAPAAPETRIQINIGSYTEAVQINNKAIRLVGGYASCSASLPTGTSTISAPPGTRPMTVSVGSISRVVLLLNLNLNNGEPGALDTGGGLLATASTASLLLAVDNVYIEANIAGNGGGVGVQTFSATGVVTVSLGLGNLINNNSALADGGGIWCGGPGQNAVLLGDVIIQNNIAGATGGDNARGGAIFADRCRVRWNGNRFLFPDSPSLRNNRSYGAGGGIYARNGSELDLRSLFVFDQVVTSVAPIRIANNQAIGPAGDPGAGPGGGILVDASSLHARGVWIENNSATGNGGGVHASNGSQVRIDRDISDPDATVTPVGVCHTPSDCSRISRNTAADTGGAIFLTNSGTQATIEQTIVRDNSAQAGTGASLFAQTGSTLTVISSLLYNGNPPNGIPNYVFWVGNSAFVNLFWSTVVDNVPGSAVFRFGGTNSLLTLRGSIIYEVGRPMGLVSAGNTPSVDSDCVIWHNDSLMNPPYNFTGGAAFHLVANPAFANPAVRDYQLTLDSPAVDFCDQSIFPGTAPATDLLLRPRGIWVAPVPRDGPFDLGAYELAPDRIFSDRFE